MKRSSPDSIPERVGVILMLWFSSSLLASSMSWGQAPDVDDIQRTEQVLRTAGKDLARGLRQAGRHSEAHVELGRVLQRDPDDHEARYLRWRSAIDAHLNRYTYDNSRWKEDIDRLVAVGYQPATVDREYAASRTLRVERTSPGSATIRELAHAVQTLGATGGGRRVFADEAQNLLLVRARPIFPGLDAVQKALEANDARKNPASRLNGHWLLGNQRTNPAWKAYDSSAKELETTLVNTRMALVDFVVRESLRLSDSDLRARLNDENFSRSIRDVVAKAEARHNSSAPGGSPLTWRTWW